MVTIKDVARLAGVSISTVSHVINKNRAVSRQTKAKVLKAILEGYLEAPVFPCFWGLLLHTL